MSLMKFREPNQVKWVGVRPGHNGTQIKAEAIAVNNTQVLYTVTAGKMLYLCTLNWQVDSNVGGGNTLIYHYNSGSVLQHVFVSIGQFSAPVLANTISFWPPYEMASGDYIQIWSPNAGTSLYCGIFGWEE